MSQNCRDISRDSTSRELLTIHLNVPIVTVRKKMLRNNVLAAALGVLAHQVVFIHGEWHLRAPAVVIVHFLIGIFIYTTEISKDERNGLFSATILVSVYLASLLSSISIYRLFFHPLRHFPGPRLVALTKLWHVWKCRDSRGHHVLDEWHKKYGTFVRTGEYGILSSVQ